MRRDEDREEKYRIAGNVCGNYILQFVVKSKVCRFNVLVIIFCNL